MKNFSFQSVNNSINLSIAVVIPCYKVSKHILSVLCSIGSEVSAIYVIDDCCPEQTGELVMRESKDPRVKVIFNQENLGVGGAVLRGYAEAFANHASIIVKIDGDGQMDASMLPRLIKPIIDGRADYAKGNRFYDLSKLSVMPTIRLFGNSVLSFMAKLSTGYWGLFDPANGYTAINARIIPFLPTSKISKRYFFETDILFRLNTLRAVVLDIPMHAVYGDEVSSLKIGKILPEFLFKHIRNFCKRIFYNYYLRDMSLASLELIVGLAMLFFGIIFGSYRWLQSLNDLTPTALGVIMIAVLPIMVGFQLILAFLAFDISNVPKHPISQDLPPVPHEHIS